MGLDNASKTFIKVVLGYDGTAGKGTMNRGSYRYKGTISTLVYTLEIFGRRLFTQSNWNCKIFSKSSREGS